ncbi:MAG: AMP-binding protein [Desulfobacter sp.]|nr:MAG: AMP-binding protein [Desulfobacter sp.]
MLIREKIHSFFANYNKVVDTQGNSIDRNVFLSEYNRIKTYLFQTYSTDDIVGLYLKKDHRYLLTILACMDLGLTYVPMRKSWPKERVNQINEICGLSAVLEDDFFSCLPISTTENIEGFAVSPEKSLYIMFTSGSTGEPKGVKIQRKAYENFLFWLDSFFEQITEKDRLLNSTDYTFDVSLVDVGLLILKNVNFVLSNFTDNIFVLLGELDKYEITTLATVPNNLMMILQQGIFEKADLSNLNNILIAGSRFPVKLYEQMVHHFPDANLYNCYGPTEATIYCVVKELVKDNSEDIRHSTVSIGKPILNTHIKLINEEGLETTPYEKGEMLVGGNQLMAGYVNRSSLTNKALVEIDGSMFYRTGDLVFRDENSFLYMVGRIDDTIKTAGHRVNLLDVDSYIQKIDFVKSCVTVAIPHEIKENLLVTFVILSPQGALSMLREAIEAILPTHQQPYHLEIVKEFPLNNSGKISSLALKELYLSKYAD